MSKTVWIINQYASTPETGMGGRSYYLAQQLAKRGYKVYLIASSANHLLHSAPRLSGNISFEEITGFTFVWVKMPAYAEAHSKQRALNWFLFPWRIQKLAREIKDKPDAILCSSPSPIAFLGAQRLAKKFGARLIFEVRDIWPLTLVEIGGFSPRHPFIRFMQWVEDKAYRDSDAVISNLRNSVEHMIERGLDKAKFAWIPNGFSLDEVSQNVPLNETASSQLPQGKFIIGYTGTLGVANALDTLIEAADKLKDYTDIAFVMVGSGKQKNALKMIVNKKGLGNLFFIDPIPKVEIQSMLEKFDACYKGWLDEPIYRYGIAANKIFDYLYSAKPIIHAYSGAFDPIVEAGAGLKIQAQDSVKLAEAVLKIYKMPPGERKQMGLNGRKVALEEYEYGQLAVKLERVLFPPQSG